MQLTKNGELVVIHDERVDRTTEGIGFVRDFTLAQLKKLHIYAGDRPSQQILTMAEVFDLTEHRMKEGMKLNIELKTGSYPYPGIEEKLVNLVHSRRLSEGVIYSSFDALSLEKLRGLDPGGSNRGSGQQSFGLSV